MTLAALPFANRRSLNATSERLRCQQEKLAFDICWTPSTRSLDGFRTEALMVSLEQGTDLALLAHWPGTSRPVMLLETDGSWNVQEHIALERCSGFFPDRRMNISSSHGFLTFFNDRDAPPFLAFYHAGFASPRSVPSQTMLRPNPVASLVHCAWRRKLDFVAIPMPTDDEEE